MFTYALNLISYAINSCIAFFLRLEFSFGFVSVLIGIFIAYTATRLLLIPIIGGASSDLVQSSLKIAKVNSNIKKVNSQYTWPRNRFYRGNRKG